MKTNKQVVPPLTHPFHIQLEMAGHKLKRYEDDGEVDIFAYESGFCNGPKCVLCGESWCHHCGGRIIRCTGITESSQSSKSETK